MSSVVSLQEISEEESGSAAQVATQLARTPSVASSEHIQQQGSQPPAGFTVLLGPPTHSDTQSEDCILVGKRPRRGIIPIMSIDTPRPTRAGAFFTQEEVARY